jgi:hypothetical protein
MVLGGHSPDGKRKNTGEYARNRERQNAVFWDV